MIIGDTTIRLKKSDVPEESDSLGDWVIVRDGANEAWLGKLSEIYDCDRRFCAPGAMRLSPAYSVLGGWQVGGDPRNPTVGKLRLVVPAEHLVSAREVFVVPASVVSVGGLDDVDKRMLREAMKLAEGMRDQLAAKRLGLERASSVPKFVPGA